MRLFFFILAISLPYTTFCQGETYAEEEPTFNGGNTALYHFISENVVYPQISIEQRDQGKVFVEFIIEKSGEITNAKIVRGVSPELDKEAIRVIEKMPPWNPGTQSGKPVRTRFTIPINFRLGDDAPPTKKELRKQKKQEKKERS